MKNNLYIMVGIPGSGKSTYAKNYLFNATYISRDQIRFNFVKENEEYFSKEQKVFNQFINDIQKELDSNKNVIADATHLNSKSRMKLLSALKINKNKTKICAVYMNTPLEVCILRNETRKGTRAYVPEAVIKSMYKSLKKPNSEECGGLIDEVHIINYKKEE